MAFTSRLRKAGRWVPEFSAKNISQEFCVANPNDLEFHNHNHKHNHNRKHNHKHKHNIEMQAAVYQTNGKHSEVVTLTTVPRPVPKAHQVLVRINVAALNPIDGLVIAGYLTRAGWKNDLPGIVGYDFAGVVESVGADVTSFKVGDRVAAVNWGERKHDDGDEPVGGAFAQFIAISAQKLSLIPAAVSDDIAAAVQLVGTTAWQALFGELKVKAGDKVLILGGSSAVGSLAIQLAKNAGAWVATTTSAKNRDYVAQWKPDLIVDYNAEKWEEHAGIRDFDSIFDTIGEANVFARAKTPGLLKTNGSFVSIVNHDAGYNPQGHAPLAYAAFFALSNKVSVQDELLASIASGTLKAVIDQEFPFTQDGVQQLFDKQASNRSLGKNILRIA